MRLSGKKALVTGASSGIGLAIARRFAAEGADVALVARNEARLCTLADELGKGSLVIPADVRDLASLGQMARRVEAEWGRLDIVVANAGIGRPVALEAVTSELYHEVLDTNVRGSLFTVAQCLPLMRAGGVVLLMSSVAHSKGISTMGLYCASKAAIRSLGRTLAAELAPREIRVNVLSPGAIETPIYENAGFPADHIPAIKEAFRTQTTLGRLGTSEEVAATAAFLASADASYMTGADLVVDGGWTQV